MLRIVLFLGGFLFAFASHTAPAHLSGPKLARAQAELAAAEPREALELHLDLAGHYLLTRHHGRLLPHAEKAVELAMAHGNTAQQAIARTYVGRAHDMAGEIETATGELTDALTLAESSGSTQAVVFARRSLALHYGRLGLIDSGYLNGYRALELARESGDSLAIARTLDVLAFLASNAEDYAAEAAWREEALSRFRQLDANWEAIDQQGKLAATLIDLGELETGEKLLRESINMAAESGNMQLLAWLHAASATVEKQNGDLQAAAAAYRKALRIATEAGINDDASHFRAALADALLELDQVAEAREQITRALEFFSNGPPNLFHTSTLLTAYKVFMAAGETPQAVNYFKSYVAVMERRFDTITKARLADLERRVEADRQVEELERLRLQRKQDARVRIAMGGVTLLAVVLVVLLALRYRRRVHDSRSIEERNRELQHAYSKLDTLAKKDHLTGLMNRRAFQERADAEVKRLPRMMRPSAIGVVDLDHFKRVNDRWGHDFGDEVLQAVAKALKENVRREDAVARWGGEEFLLLLTGVHMDEAKLICEKLRSEVAALYVQDGEAETRMTVTIGVAPLTEKVGFKQALRNADEALYFGKHHGRDQVVVAGEGPVEIDS